MKREFLGLTTGLPNNVNVVKSSGFNSIRISPYSVVHLRLNQVAGHPSPRFNLLPLRLLTFASFLYPGTTSMKTASRRDSKTDGKITMKDNLFPE
jgi:hypothetical protein